MNLQTLVNRLMIMTGLGCATLASADFELAKLKDYYEPNYPISATFDGVVEGTAEIAVDIDKDGKLTDWLPLRTTHPDFVREIRRVIDEWTFYPATMNGEPSPAVQRFVFNFEYRDFVNAVGVTSAAIFLDLAGKWGPKSLVASLADLDKIPEPVHIVQPYRAADDPEKQWVGEVVITFFIDTEGNVRLPVVTKLEGHPNIAHSANTALVQWKFEPPLKNGKPIVTKVSQPFRFGLE